MDPSGKLRMSAGSSAAPPMIEITGSFRILTHLET
jgi:hypothetical protein